MACFRFEELTWPEVAALPRSTVLILPLGAGCTPDEIPASVQAAGQVGLLPGLPFGWLGSGLEVRPDAWNALVRALVGNLLEDGFTQVFVLAPPGVDLPQDVPLLQGAARRPAAPQPGQGETGKVVLLPIGHTEQHGYHAPLATDTLIIDALGQGTARAVPEQAVCLPAFPYGVSTHRRSFAGTFSIGGRTFEDFWLAVLDELVGRGFNRFYLLSGHGGNSSFLVNVIKYAGEKYPEIFCATSFLYLSGPQGVAALESRRQSAQGGMGHACELETSLVLHLRPDLVHLERAVDELDFISTPSYYMDWIEGGALSANPPWSDDTRTGAYGAGSLGTVEKGDYWLQVAIEEKAAHVAEIHEQYRRRRERRARMED